MTMKVMPRLAGLGLAAALFTLGPSLPRHAAAATWIGTFGLEA